MDETTQIEAKWRLVADLATHGGQKRDLRGIDLNGADLKAVNLSEANLTQANLSQADLRQADLSGTDLSGVNLIDALLDDVNLMGARYDGETKWPKYFEVSKSRAVLVEVPPVDSPVAEVAPVEVVVAGTTTLEVDSLDEDELPDWLILDDPTETPPLTSRE